MTSQYNFLFKFKKLLFIKMHLETGDWGVSLMFLKLTSLFFLSKYINE